MPDLVLITAGAYEQREEPDISGFKPQQCHHWLYDPEQVTCLSPGCRISKMGIPPPLTWSVSGGLNVQVAVKEHWQRSQTGLKRDLFVGSR